MIELHGWLTIRETFGDEDLLSRKETDEINARVDTILENADGHIVQKFCNGERYLNVLFSSNHRTSETDNIIGVFKRVSEAADGSYGIIYLWDDEDEDHYNEFRVFVFRKGKCECETDKFFSPVIPKIEDEK